MPISPSSATLTGPTSGLCGVPSTAFTVTLDQPADVGGVVVTVSDTVGGDTVTTSPFTIPAGQTTGTFTITPSTCGNRNISITTVPALTIIGSPITYDALCNCPDDSGGNSRVQAWTRGATVCPPTFSASFNMTPSTVWAEDMYCQTTVLNLTITE